MTPTAQCSSRRPVSLSLSLSLSVCWYLGQSRYAAQPRGPFGGELWWLMHPEAPAKDDTSGSREKRLPCMASCSPIVSRCIGKETVAPRGAEGSQAPCAPSIERPSTALVQARPRKSKAARKWPTPRLRSHSRAMAERPSAARLDCYGLLINFVEHDSFEPFIDILLSQLSSPSACLSLLIAAYVGLGMDQRAVARYEDQVGASIRLSISHNRWDGDPSRACEGHVLMAFSSERHNKAPDWISPGRSEESKGSIRLSRRDYIHQSFRRGSFDHRFWGQALFLSGAIGIGALVREFPNPPAVRRRSWDGRRGGTSQATCASRLLGYPSLGRHHRSRSASFRKT